jgi:regulator of sirC expression with transglutaminase-like and TPR domain
MLFYGTVEELSGLLTGKNENVDLDRAALRLATIEFPDLEITPFVQLLDSYAVELAGRLIDPASGSEYVTVANNYLFDELGFVGNSTDYYNPANSCLNEVLTARIGIPITLSIVYMEIGRRLEKPIYGIGLPGHFLVQYNDGGYSTFIDPFHGGKLLAAEDCYQLARDVAGIDIAQDTTVLEPVTKRQMIFRMINNLRGIYFSRRSYRKALQVLNLLLEANPDSADEYKQRGIVYLQLRQMKPARSDLEKYLELAPEAKDREEIEKQLMTLKRWLVGMN